MRYKALLVCLFSVQLAAAQQKEVIPFTWTENYSAMMVRVKFKDHPGTYYMQLDLGAPKTVLYKNALAFYRLSEDADQAVGFRKT